MKIFILFLIFNSSFCEFPTDLHKLTDAFEFKSSKEGNTVNLWFHKKRVGHLGFGLAKDMSKGDVLLVEFKKVEGEDQDQVVFSNCKLVGHKHPDCSVKDGMWTLIEFELLEGGSWKAHIKGNLEKTEIEAVKANTYETVFTMSDDKTVTPH